MFQGKKSINPLKLQFSNLMYKYIHYKGLKLLFEINL